MPHHVGRAAEGADRKPAADDLPEHRQVGADAEPLLRAAARDPEAGDHLVEDEQRARRVAELAQRLEEARRGRDDAHVPGDRLDDHAREALAVALERPGGGVDVVVRRDDRVRSGPAGTPAVAGTPSVAGPEPASASSESACPW